MGGICGCDNSGKSGKLVFPEYPDILVLPDILVFAGLFLSQYDFIQGEAEGFEGVGAVELVEGEGVGAGR